jgi:hypothetical protein
MKVENFRIESKFKNIFKKGDMHVVIIIELTTIVSSIIVFELGSYVHLDSIKEFKSIFQN